MNQSEMESNNGGGVFPPLKMESSLEMEEEFLLDLESYLSRYEREARIVRLQFIMERSTEGGTLYSMTRQLLKEKLQEMGNIVTYKQVFEEDSYLEMAESHFKEQRLACERRYGATLLPPKNVVGGNHKEAVRVAQVAMAECHARVGDYTTAVRKMTTFHTKKNTLFLKWAWYGEEYGSIRDASPTGEVMGLYHLVVSGNMKEASMQFLSCFQNQDETIFLAQEDVGLYLVMLVLASQSRENMLDLMSKHLMNKNDSVERIPMILRDALLQYTRAQYGSCLQLLQQVITKHVTYDVYLYPHIHKLWEQICSNIYLLYLQPYSTVHLSQMANEFKISSEQMQNFVLNQNNKVGVRLDESTKTLHAPKVHPSSSSSTRRALKLGLALEHNLRTLLLKYSCWDQGVSVSFSYPQDGEFANRQMFHKDDNRMEDNNLMEGGDESEFNQQNDVVMMDMVEDD